jgi:hypothetical protein
VDGEPAHQEGPAGRPERSQHLLGDVVEPGDERVVEAAPGPPVTAEPGRRLLDRPMEKDGAPVVHGMCERDVRMHEREPCSSSCRLRRNGDAAANGCTEEQMSWTNPGRVSGPERLPPPISLDRSSTRTE